MKNKLNDTDLSQVCGGAITAKSSKELDEEREALIANKLACATVKDEDILNEMKLPDFNAN